MLEDALEDPNELNSDNEHDFDNNDQDIWSELELGNNNVYEDDENDE